MIQGCGVILHKLRMIGKIFRAATFGYFWHDDIIESYFGINATNQSKDFTGITIPQKNMYMKYLDLTSRGIQNFYTNLPARWTVLQPMWNKQTRFYESKVKYLFVPKFYHDRASHGFLQHLKYLGKIQESDTISELGRVFYVYKSDTARTHTFLDSDLKQKLAEAKKVLKGAKTSYDLLVKENTQLKEYILK